MLNSLFSGGTDLSNRSVDAMVYKDLLFTTPSAKIRLSHRPVPKLAVFPRHTTDSRAYYDFQSRVYKYYKENVGSKVDDDGYIVSGTSTSPEPLLTTMPYNAAFSYPIISNVKETSEKGILSDFESSEHRQIADDLAELFHSSYKDMSVPVNKVSSSGPPTYSKDIEMKMKGIEHLTVNFDDVMKFIKSGDLRGLFDKHGFVLFSTVGSRLQQDGGKMEGGLITGKPRPYFSPEYAFSGGTKGELSWVEKDLFYNEDFGSHDWLKPKKRLQARTRLVYGYQTPVVQFVNQLVTPQVEAYHSTYESTYKTRGYDDLRDWVDGAPVLGLDVSNHDIYVRNWMMAAFVDRLPLTEDVKILIMMLARAPYMRPPLNKGDAPVFSADPFKLSSYDHQLGLPSGMGLHSAFGKYFMTLSYIIMITDFIGYEGKEWLDTFLKGEFNLVKLKDSVDDALFAFPVHSELESYLKDLTKGKDLSKYKGSFKGTDAAWKRVSKGMASPYHVIEAEEGIVYLGTQISRNPLTKQTHFGPSAVNYTKNFYMPENGIHNRNFWFFGFKERKQIFANAVNGGNLMADIDNLFEKSFGEHPDDIVDLFIKNNQQEIELMMRPESPEEIEISLDPSKLLWKHLSGDGYREEFSDQFVTKIPENLRHAIFAVGFDHNKIKEYNG